MRDNAFHGGTGVAVGRRSAPAGRGGAEMTFGVDKLIGVAITG
jgi:hypothetical protein